MFQVLIMLLEARCFSHQELTIYVIFSAFFFKSLSGVQQLPD